MSTEALKNLTRKQAKLEDIQRRSNKSKMEWLRREQEAAEDLENVIALTVDVGDVTIAAAARQIGTTPGKLRVMADRARKRNREILRRGTG